MNLEEFKHKIEIGRVRLLQPNRIGKFGCKPKEAKKE